MVPLTPLDLESWHLDYGKVSKENCGLSFEFDKKATKSMNIEFVRQYSLQVVTIQ